jgi:streptomycin 6-kinase
MSRRRGIVEPVNSAVIDVPRDVRKKAGALGSPGAQWLADLPDVVRELESTWQVVVGGTLRRGSDSYVAAAATKAGEPAIIKIALPNDGWAHEIDTLSLANGRGYVRLLRHDADRQAMLQERLGESLAQLRMPVAAQIEVICETLRTTWTVPPDQRFPSGAQKARALAEFTSATWEALGRPCSANLIEHAATFAERRAAAFDPDQAVLVHGDAHAANTLRIPGEGSTRFAFVDPDGLFAERACDLAVPMRGWSQELLKGDTWCLARQRCSLLSELTGVDVQPIWEWGLIERVSTGLLALQVGREALGNEMLAVAERLATHA